MRDAPRTRARRPTASALAERFSGARGFSLLEMVVSMGVIGVLLAIVLPVLSGVRGSAQSLQSQSNLRSLYAGVMLYAEGERAFPCIVEGMLYPDIDGTTFANTYWEVENVWHGIVYPYLPHDEYQEVFFSPGLDEWSPRMIPSYAYSHSFVGSPIIWSEPAAADLTGVERPVRPGDVRFTSNKALLWDRALGFETDLIEYDSDYNIVQATPVGLADGSVRMESQASASEAVQNPLNGRLTGGMKFHNTRDGVHGLDY